MAETWEERMDRESRELTEGISARMERERLQSIADRKEKDRKHELWKKSLKVKQETAVAKEKKKIADKVAGEAEAEKQRVAAEQAATRAGSEEANKNIQMAKNKQAEELRRKQGRKSTIRTGALGLVEDANTRKKTLLGG